MAYSEADIRRIKLPGALSTIAALKLFGSVLLIAAVVAGFLSFSWRGEVRIAAVVGLLFMSALVSAAGHAVAALVEIYAEVWRLRDYAENDGDDAPSLVRSLQRHEK